LGAAEAIGVEHIPSNDFFFIRSRSGYSGDGGRRSRARYAWRGPQVDLATYFAMARGAARKAGQADCSRDGNDKVV